VRAREDGDHATGQSVSALVGMDGLSCDSALLAHAQCDTNCTTEVLVSSAAHVHGPLRDRVRHPLLHAAGLHSPSRSGRHMPYATLARSHQYTSLN
jgi:hypothetical protein